MLVVELGSEPVRAPTSARSCATRAWTRSRRSTLSFLSPALPRPVRRRRRSATTPLTAAQVTTADELGERRRQPDRDAPGQAARRPARPDRRRRDARRTRTCKVDTTRRAGCRDRRRSTIQYHGTADRYTLNGATAVATLYSNATTATTNPAVTLRVGRLERRPGGGVHLRPRPLRRLHAPGQPGLGRTGARRRRSASARTTSSSARRPATSSPTGSTRARSRSRRPTSSSACS